MNKFIILFVLCFLQIGYFSFTTKSQIKADAGDDQEVCQDYTLLNAVLPNGYTGQWKCIKGNATVSTPNLTTAVATKLSVGENLFVWSITQDTTLTDTLSVVYIDISAEAGQNRETCHDTIRLDATKPVVGEGKWEQMQGNSTIVDKSTHNSMVKNMSQGINLFYWHVKQGSCKATDLVSVNYKGFKVNAGQSGTVCGSEITLKGTPPPNNGNGKWQNIGGTSNIDDINKNITTASNLSYGENLFVWKVNANGCEFSDTVKYVNQAPTIFAGLDTIICSSSYKMQASTPDVGKGFWQCLSGSGSIQDSLSTTTLVTNLSVGINEFVWKIKNGTCTVTDTVKIVYLNPKVDAGDIQKICADSAQLSAIEIKENESGYWSGNDEIHTFSNKTNNETTVFGLKKGLNHFTWTVQNDKCKASSIVEVYNNSPSKAIAEKETHTCTNTADIKAETPSLGVGFWEIYNGMGNIADSTKAITTISNLEIGKTSLRWVVENEDCRSFADVEVHNDSVSAHTIGDEEICGDVFDLLAIPPDESTKAWWTSDNQACKIDDSTKYNTTVRNIPWGVNVFRWNLQKGECFDDATIKVTNHQIKANAGENLTVCKDIAFLSGNDPKLFNSEAFGWWEVLSGYGQLEDSTDFSTMVYDLSKGANKLRWHTSVELDDDFCGSYNDVIITNLSVEAKIAELPPLCERETNIESNFPEGGYGQWTTTGYAVIEDPTNNITQITVQEKETKLTWTVHSGECMDSDEITLYYNGFEIEGKDTVNTCTNEAYIEVSSSENGIGYWSLQGNKDAIVTESTKRKTQVQNLKYGANHFMWTEQADDCEASKEIVVINENIPKNINQDGSILKLKPNEKNIEVSWNLQTVFKYNFLKKAYLMRAIDNEENFEEIFVINQAVNTFVDEITNKEAEYVYYKIVFETENCSSEIDAISRKVKNNSPTDINLSNNTVKEANPIIDFADILIGNLSTTDADTSDVFTYSFVENDEENDNKAFQLENNQLYLIKKPDFEEKNVYNIFIETNDGRGGVFSKKFEILVEDVNYNLISGFVLGAQDNSIPNNEKTEINLYRKIEDNVELSQTVKSDLSGYFEFKDISDGSYFIQSRFTENESEFINTFYQSTYLLNKGNLLEINNDKIVKDVNFLVFQSNNEPGEGMVSGKLEEINDNAKEPAREISVLLIDKETDKPIMMAITDENGNYNFKELIDREYSVFVDLPGYTHESLIEVTISENDKNFEGKNYIIIHDDRLIKTDITSIRNDVQNRPKISVYPNPASNSFKLIFNSEKESDYEISIYNCDGKKLKTIKHLVSNQAQTVSIDEPGVYYLHFITENELYTQKIVIQ